MTAAISVTSSTAVSVVDGYDGYDNGYDGYAVDCYDDGFYLAPYEETTLMDLYKA
jgi:hypothetical protein